MSQDLRHHTAMTATVELLDLVNLWLKTNSERKEAFAKFYEVIAAALENYEKLRTRERTGLSKPSRN